MASRPGYLGEFLEFWTARPEVERVWFSLFTPQFGAEAPEILTPEQRQRVVAEILDLRERFPKADMRVGVVRQFLRPPHSPADCIFAQTTRTISADLRTVITPCQFGGEPDCAQCGCYASMALAAIGAHRIGGIMPVAAIFRASAAIGRVAASRRDRAVGTTPRGPLVQIEDAE
jgi:hypothetical protein